MIRRHQSVGTDAEGIGDVVDLQEALASTQQRLSESEALLFTSRRERDELDMAHLETKGHLLCKKRAIAYLRTTLYQDLMALRRQTLLLEHGLVFDARNAMVVGQPIPAGTYSAPAPGYALGTYGAMDEKTVADGQAEFPPLPTGRSGVGRGVGGRTRGGGGAFSLGLGRSPQTPRGSTFASPTDGGAASPSSPATAVPPAAASPNGSAPATNTNTSNNNGQQHFIIPNEYEDFSYLDAFKLIETEDGEAREEAIKAAVLAARNAMQRAQEGSRDAMERRMASTVIALREVEAAYLAARRELQTVEAALEAKTAELADAIAQEKERLAELQQRAEIDAEAKFKDQLAAMEEKVRQSDERSAAALAEAEALKDASEAKLAELDAVFITHKKEIAVLHGHIAREREAAIKATKALGDAESGRTAEGSKLAALEERLADEKEANRRFVDIAVKLRTDLAQAQAAAATAAAAEQQVIQLQRQVKGLLRAGDKQKEALEDLAAKNVLLEGDVADAKEVAEQRLEAEAALRARLDASYEKEDKLRDEVAAAAERGSDAAAIARAFAAATAAGGGGVTAGGAPLGGGASFAPTHRLPPITSVADMYVALGQSLAREEQLRARIRVASVLFAPKGQLQQVRGAFQSLIALLPPETLTAKGDPSDPSNTPDRTIRSGIEKLHELNNYMDAATLTLLSDAAAIPQSLLGQLALPSSSASASASAAAVGAEGGKGGSPAAQPLISVTGDGGGSASLRSPPVDPLSLGLSIGSGASSRSATPIPPNSGGGGGGLLGSQQSSTSPLSRRRSRLSVPSSAGGDTGGGEGGPPQPYPPPPSVLPSYIPQRYASRACSLQFRLPSSTAAVRSMAAGLGAAVGMRAPAEEADLQKQKAEEGAGGGGGADPTTAAASASTSSTPLHGHSGPSAPLLTGDAAAAVVERAFRGVYGDLTPDDVKYLDAMRQAVLMSSAEKAAGWAREHEAPPPLLDPMATFRGAADGALGLGGEAEQQQQRGGAASPRHGRRGSSPTNHQQQRDKAGEPEGSSGGTYQQKGSGKGGGMGNRRGSSSPTSHANANASSSPTGKRPPAGRSDTPDASGGGDATEGAGKPRRAGSIAQQKRPTSASSVAKSSASAADRKGSSGVAIVPEVKRLGGKQPPRKGASATTTAAADKSPSTASSPRPSSAQSVASTSRRSAKGGGGGAPSPREVLPPIMAVPIDDEHSTDRNNGPNNNNNAESPLLSSRSLVISRPSTASRSTKRSAFMAGAPQLHNNNNGSANASRLSDLPHPLDGEDDEEGPITVGSFFTRGGFVGFGGGPSEAAVIESVAVADVGCQWEEDAFSKYPSFSFSGPKGGRKSSPLDVCDGTAQTDAPPGVASTAAGPSRPLSAVGGGGPSAASRPQSASSNSSTVVRLRTVRSINGVPQHTSAQMASISSALEAALLAAAAGGGGGGGNASSRPPSSPAGSFAFRRQGSPTGGGGGGGASGLASARSGHSKDSLLRQQPSSSNGLGIVAPGERDADGILEDDGDADDDAVDAAIGGLRSAVGTAAIGDTDLNDGGALGVHLVGGGGGGGGASEGMGGAFSARGLSKGVSFRTRPDDAEAASGVVPIGSVGGGSVHGSIRIANVDRPLSALTDHTTSAASTGSHHSHHHSGHNNGPLSRLPTAASLAAAVGAIEERTAAPSACGPPGGALRSGGSRPPTAASVRSASPPSLLSDSVRGHNRPSSANGLLLGIEGASSPMRSSVVGGGAAAANRVGGNGVSHVAVQTVPWEEALRQMGGSLTVAGGNADAGALMEVLAQLSRITANNNTTANPSSASRAPLQTVPTCGDTSTNQAVGRSRGTRPQSAPFAASSSANVSAVNRFYSNTSAQQPRPLAFAHHNTAEAARSSASVEGQGHGGAYSPWGATVAATAAAAAVGVGLGHGPAPSHRSGGGGGLPRPLTAGTNSGCLYRLSTPTVIDMAPPPHGPHASGLSGAAAVDFALGPNGTTNANADAEGNTIGAADTVPPRASDPIGYRQAMSRKGRALAAAILNESAISTSSCDADAQGEAGDGEEGAIATAEAIPAATMVEGAMGSGGAEALRSPTGGGGRRRPHSAASALQQFRPPSATIIRFDGETPLFAAPLPQPIPHTSFASSSSLAASSPSRGGTQRAASATGTRKGSATTAHQQQRSITSASAVRRNDVRTATNGGAAVPLLRNTAGAGVAGPMARRAGSVSSGGGAAAAAARPPTPASADLSVSGGGATTALSAAAAASFADLMPPAKWASVQGQLETHWAREAAMVAAPLRETLRPDLNVLGMDRNDRFRLLNDTRSSSAAGGNGSVHSRPSSALGGSLLSRRR